MEPKPDVQLYGTSGLCFDKDCFMRDDFNVDDFMREYQCSGDDNLDTLRDDLGIYLKILRSAMIDLINRDYADFVNLSTNLTGLDSLIQALTVPLGQLKEEVLSVHQLLESASTGVLSDLEQQHALQQYKRKLTTLSDIAKRLNNLEELLNQSGLDSDVMPLKKTTTDTELSNADRDQQPRDASGSGAPEQTDASDSSVETDFGNLCLAVCTPEELLDRFAAELSYLNYLAKSCEGTKLMTIYRPRLSRIQSAVETAIERNLKSGLGFSTDNSDSPRSSKASTDASSASSSVGVSLLRRTLIACAVMDAEAVAEGVVREMLAPRINEVVNEGALRSNPRGLGGVLSSLLALLHARLEPLLALTTPRRLNNSVSEEEVAGFRFVERAVFPEVTAALASLPDFYSPANPTAFHQRYLQFMEFIEDVERLLVTRQRVDDFRALAAYQKFMDEWNLAVYFQIRNQEIGQVVESSLCEENGLKLYLNETKDSQSSSYGPSVSRPHKEGAGEAVAVLGSTRGVLRGVMQGWLPEVFLPPLLHRFWKLTLLVFARHRTWLTDTIAALQRGDLKSLYGSPSTKTSTSSTVGPKPSPPRPSVVELAVYLLSDLALLQDNITCIYDKSIAEHLQHAQDTHRNMIKATLSSESSKLSSSRESLLLLVSRDVASAMTRALQPVTDTPRLYRRTNRSAPRQPQQYVSAVMSPLQKLHDIASTRLSPDHMRQCYSTICATVAQQYYSLTSEVLANVSKAEESLRRLKRARGNTAVASSQEKGLTDEDKIRDQLHLDVQAFGEQLRSLGVVTEDIAEYVKLSDTVRDARTATTTSSGATQQT